MGNERIIPEPGHPEAKKGRTYFHIPSDRPRRTEFVQKVQQLRYDPGDGEAKLTSLPDYSKGVKASGWIKLVDVAQLWYGHAVHAQPGKAGQQLFKWLGW